MIGDCVRLSNFQSYSEYPGSGLRNPNPPPNFGKFGKFAHLQGYFEFHTAGNSAEMEKWLQIKLKVPTSQPYSGYSGLQNQRENCCGVRQIRTIRKKIARKFGKFGKFANLQRNFEFPAAGNPAGKWGKWLEIEL